MKLWKTACRRARGQFDEYVDGELKDASWLESHLSSCAECCCALERVREVARSLDSVARREAPVGFAERVMAALPDDREAASRQEAILPRRRQVALAPVFGVAFAATAAMVIVAAVVTFRTPPRPPEPTRIATVTPGTPDARVGTVEQGAETGGESGVTALQPAGSGWQPATARPRGTGTTRRPAIKTPEPIEAVDEPAVSAEELRAAAAEYEQEGRIGEALSAYSEADEIAEEASLDTARAYEMAGFAGEAIYRYAEIAF